MHEVRVSVANMLQRFHGCEPDYIRDVCHARCCDAPGRPSGTMISIHDSEVPVIVRRGGMVHKGLLVTPERVCTFKDRDSLCSLHFTPDKPFGCIASPFTLNGKDCLIVRNRYRTLRCYEPTTGTPAYIAFGAGLVRIFGEATAWALTQALDSPEAKGVRFLVVSMPDDSYEMLKANDEAKRQAH